MFCFYISGIVSTRTKDENVALIVKKALNIGFISVRVLNKFGVRSWPKNLDSDDIRVSAKKNKN